MNPNIRLRAKQCFQIDEYGEAIVSIEEIERFAKLIAQDCMYICQGHNKPPTLNFDPYERASDAIKGFFDVYGPL